MATRQELELIEKVSEITNIMVQLKERCDGYERENKYLKDLLSRVELKNKIII